LQNCVISYKALKVVALDVHVQLDVLLQIGEYLYHDRRNGSNLLGSHLGGVVVSVLATGPKSRWFKPGRSDGFLRAIKILSTPFIGWEVKPEVLCKILRHVKIPLKCFRH
jgi:hypothetical protein